MADWPHIQVLDRQCAELIGAEPGCLSASTCQRDEDLSGLGQSKHAPIRATCHGPDLVLACDKLGLKSPCPIAPEGAWANEVSSAMLAARVPGDVLAVSFEFVCVCAMLALRTA